MTKILVIYYWIYLCTFESRATHHKSEPTINGSSSETTKSADGFVTGMLVHASDASYIHGNFTFGKFPDHRTGQCVRSPEELTCKSWSKECRYGDTSKMFQEKSLFDSKWKIIEHGQFDVEKWENRTLTKILPDLPVLVARLYGVKNTAQLYSEKIPCTAKTEASKNLDPNIEVSFKFWATKNITLTVFLYDPLKDTVIASSSVFRQESKQYPGPFHAKFVHFSPKPFVVRFLAQGTFKAPGYLFLDDVTYAGHFCKNAACDLCNYINFQDPNAVDNSWQEFAVHSRTHKNLATGIRWPVEGQSFASVYTKPGQKAMLASAGQIKSEGIRTVYPLNADKIIKFKYYKAVDKVDLKGCCDNINNCPWSAGADSKIYDFDHWQGAQFVCRVGTLKVLFFVDNHGPNQGSVAVDDIQLYCEFDGKEQNDCPKVDPSSNFVPSPGGQVPMGNNEIDAQTSQNQTATDFAMAPLDYGTSDGFRNTTPVTIASVVAETELSNNVRSVVSK